MEYKIDVHFSGNKETFAWVTRVYYDGSLVDDNYSLTKWGAFRVGRAIARRHAKEMRKKPKPQKQRDFSKRYVV